MLIKSPTPKSRPSGKKPAPQKNHPSSHKPEPYLDSYTKDKIGRVVAMSVVFGGVNAILPGELGGHLSRASGAIALGFGGITLGDKLAGHNPSDGRFLASLGLQMASIVAGGAVGHVLHTNFGLAGRVASGVLAGVAVGLVD